MSRLLTTRRTRWLPGVALAGAAFGIATLLGGGAEAWAFAGGLTLGGLAVSGLLRWRKGRPAAPGEPRSRPKLEPIQRGQRGYDLESDRSTDSQRWLM